MMSSIAVGRVANPRYTWPVRMGRSGAWWIFAWSCLIGATGFPPTASGQDTTPSPRSSDDDPSGDRPRLILVVGAGGAAEYTDAFHRAAEAWEELGKQRGWQVARIEHPLAADSGRAPSVSDAPRSIAAETGDTRTPKQQLQDALEAATDAAETWLVLLGHGTYAQNVARFNLIGPDVTASELGRWVEGLSGGIVLIQCSSASAPFLTEISAPNRVVVTATRAGSEYNYARFGSFLAQTLGDISADLDHDGDVSLLEAFLAASRKTQRFYDENARLATEHAMLDDNGDRIGTTADFYRGVRVVRQAAQGQPVDGQSAARIVLFHGPHGIVFSPDLEHQRQQIEKRLDQLRSRKQDLPEDAYFDALESMLLELAALYDQAEQQQAANRPTAAPAPIAEASEVTGPGDEKRKE